VSDDSDIEIAAVADTPEQLERLFRNKHEYWEWAAFVSLLVQGRNKLQPLAEQARSGFAPSSGVQVHDIRRLRYLYEDLVDQLWRLLESLAQSISSAPFRRLFGDKVLYDSEPTRREIADAANALIDFYRANLMLGRNVRGTFAKAEYAKAIEDMARLVDMPLQAIDQFITQFVGFMAVVPSIARTGEDVSVSHAMGLDLGLDDALIKRIDRELKFLEQPWRRILWPW
jgi:hypothetical protein